MSGNRVPTGGHPEAAGGIAFNAAVGQGVADAIVKLVGAQSGVRTICDLGCGNGYIAGRLGALGFAVLGIDADDAYIDIAREYHGAERVAFTQRLIGLDLARELRQTREPFDLVVSSDVIEHLYDPFDFVEAAFALLRPGGVAILGTPYHGYLKNLAISIAGGWDEHHSVHWHGGHIKFFSVDSLSRMMVRAGFEAPRFSYYGRMPLLWKNMFAVASRPR